MYTDRITCTYVSYVGWYSKITRIFVKIAQNTTVRRSGMALSRAGCSLCHSPCIERRTQQRRSVGVQSLEARMVMDRRRATTRSAPATKAVDLVLENANGFGVVDCRTAKLKCE